MKRLLALVVAAIFMAALASCSSVQADSPYFTGKVLEKYENRCLMEVTDIGNGNFFVGETLIVNTDIAGADPYEAGDLLTITFDGKVALSYPAQVLNVFEVRKQN